MPTVNLDTASRLDIICRKGDTFNLTIDFGTALSDAYAENDFKMQVRDTDTSSEALINASNSQDSGTFAIDGTELTIIIDDAVMDNNDGGEYVYDLQSDSSEGVKTWLHGFFTIIEDITE
jgi:hypothetical protein